MMPQRIIIFFARLSQLSIKTRIETDYSLHTLLVKFCLSQLSIKTRIETKISEGYTSSTLRLSQLSIKTRIETSWYGKVVERQHRV